jgi:hypothetical protein
VAATSSALLVCWQTPTFNSVFVRNTCQVKINKQAW